MTNVNRYPAHVFWSSEDEGFIAIAPDLPGCSAFGESQQEALTELQDAIAAWIEAAQSAGNPILSRQTPPGMLNIVAKCWFGSPESCMASWRDWRSPKT